MMSLEELRRFQPSCQKGYTPKDVSRILGDTLVFFWPPEGDTASCPADRLCGTDHGRHIVPMEVADRFVAAWWARMGPYDLSGLHMEYRIT